METHWPYLAAGVIGGWVVLAGLSRVGRGLRRLKARRRMIRSRRGEVVAEQLLERHGFRILGRQVELAWDLPTNAGPVRVDLRADLLVRRGGKRYVAEVKTGSTAPSLTSARTRRQLLEYATAYDVHGALLVDPEANQITEVFFPRRTSPWLAWVAIAALAALLGWLVP